VKGILTLNWPIVFSGLGAALLLYAVLILPSVRRLLCARPLIWLGHISFSLYLLHSMFLTAITPWIIHWLGLGAPSFFVSLAAVTLVSLAAAHLFWRWIDVPFMRLADRFGDVATRDSAR
jgi:peptidoglycan/LPS O-acetylase OafA/YrhL